MDYYWRNFSFGIEEVRIRELSLVGLLRARRKENYFFGGRLRGDGERYGLGDGQGF